MTRKPPPHDRSTEKRAIHLDVRTVQWVLVLLFLSGTILPLLAASGGAESTSAPIFRWRPFLAPFHAVVLHFPIGFITVAFLLEIYQIFRPNDELRRVTIMVIWLSLFSGIVSASFGILRAAGGGYEPRAVELHRNFGLAVPVLTLVTLAMQRFAYREEKQRLWTLGYRTLLFSTLALITVAGHFGGNLTHGSNYLVQNAPHFVRQLLDEAPSVAQTATPTGQITEEERFYLDRIQPIFAAKCYGCHGPEKQKGGYRLDQAENALRGGDSEETAIKPGDPLQSHLVKLILLPEEDDDVMPPSGKEPLNREELGTILDWIRRGAVFPRNVGNLTSAQGKP